MSINTLEITGQLYLNPLYWCIKNKYIKESLIVHLILKEDHKKEIYSNIPIYIFDEEAKDFITKNTALDKENVLIKGELSVIKHKLYNKFQFSSQTYIAITKKGHGIFPLRENHPM